VSCRVVLTGGRSKLLRLARLAADQGRLTRRARPAREMVRQYRLNDSDRADLLAAYASGVGTIELAARFGIHRDVVCNHLKRAGVLRPREALNESQVREAIRMRDEGLLFREIGERFGVHKDTVRRAILRARLSGERINVIDGTVLRIG
jgi:DNA-directed RNA polymerase specialized sigma24 family protein